MVIMWMKFSDGMISAVSHRLDRNIKISVTSLQKGLAIQIPMFTATLMDRFTYNLRIEFYEIVHICKASPDRDYDTKSPFYNITLYA